MNKLFKSILVSGLLITASGCERERTTETRPITNDYKLPPELSDCRIYEMDSKYNRDLYVVRRPMQTTTSEHHSCGKNCVRKTEITTDGF